MVGYSTTTFIALGSVVTSKWSAIAKVVRVRAEVAGPHAGPMRGAQSALKPVGLSADAGARAGQVQVQGAGGSAYDDPWRVSLFVSLVITLHYITLILLPNLY